MKPASQGSTVSEAESTPEQDGMPPSTPDWYTRFASLPKKEDFQKLVDEVTGTLQTEISVVRTSLAFLETRISTLEERDSCARGPDPAVTR
ncbi:Hypothetical predicted protein [Pelobates cultripes]|uniref:Uncharacterized protein n=1 Tax=Pelobates cultripes TaxID=61616 RepID=A0AAD1VNB7_PELCU|nr:Hypothetical predicted protein [Pelobates cultripes]